MEKTNNTLEKLEELKAENERLKKESELKTAWISLISHDYLGVFNNYLGLIDAWEQKLIDETEYFKLLPEVKRDIQKNLKTLTDTSHWIKTQSDGFKLHHSEVYAVELFLHLKIRFQKKLKNKNINFVFQGIESKIIYTDRLLIEFILGKILDNAIKYSFPQTSVYFSVTESNMGTTLMIKDVGTGMSQTQLQTICSFDSPIHRGTAGEIGAGLSMILIKKFVHLLKGDIEIDSNKDKGTTVSVYL